MLGNKQRSGHLHASANAHQPPSAAQVSEASSPLRADKDTLPDGCREAPYKHLQMHNRRNYSPLIPPSLENHRSNSANSSNPQQWFDRSNDNARASSAFARNSGSPFDIRQHAAEPMQAPSWPLNAWTVPTMLPLRGGGLPQYPVSDDKLEDFRGVIDDLTVRNKRLKRKLKHFRQKDEPTDSEKLLELKVHGLPAPKKRELEDMVKKFIRGLDQPPTPQASILMTEPPNAPMIPAAVKPTSSHTSTKFADSGYGSMATSNQGFPQSRPSIRATPTNRPLNGIEASKARNRSIQTYLHDIPEGLLPGPAPTFMTEGAKKRAVVTRLEQLFQGKGATDGGHQQHVQQQEVSQTAARDDRSAIEARGQRAALEGKREAPIMGDMDGSIESSTAKDPSDTFGGKTQTFKKPSQKREPVECEQRPTRPLDLDPHRAQDPDENIGYLRHLGFHMVDTESKIQLEGDQGWLYLNVVANLAQLHTLNVTTDVIRDAINEYSSRFELSQDGRKIRWRHVPLAKLHKSNSTDSDGDPSLNSSHGEHTRKRVRLNGAEPSSRSESSEFLTSKKMTTVGGSRRSSFVPTYNSRVGTSDMVDSTDIYDNQSLPQNPGFEDPTSLESSAWTSLNKTLSQSGAHKSQDDGSLVFYKAQKFFLDKSRDDSAQIQSRRRKYAVKPMYPLGIRPRSESSVFSSDDSPSASIQAAVSSASQDGNLDTHSPHDNIEVYGSRDHSSVSYKQPHVPVDFEASGLGCVYPSDNFAIYTTREMQTARGPPPKKCRRISTTDQGINASTTHVTSRITGAKIQPLPPSSIPPAFYYVSDSESDDSDSEAGASECEESSYQTVASSNISDSESEADEHGVQQSVEPEQSGNYGAIEASSVMNIASTRTEELSDVSTDVNDDDDDDDEGHGSKTESSGGSSRCSVDTNGREQRSPSLDLLASAREADPQAIMEREREYDAEMAERLAEEMPAGSSAATHGKKCGSGYNSPVPALDGMDVDGGGELDVQDADDRAEERSVSS